MNKEQKTMIELADANIYGMKQLVSNAPFDKSLEGLVIGFNKEENTYSVEINKYVYDNVPSLTSNIKVNDTVTVCIIQNNFSQLVILGKYSDAEEDTKRELDNINNIITGDISYLGSSKPYYPSTDLNEIDMRTRVYVLPKINYAKIEPTHNTELYFKEMLKWLVRTYKDKFNAYSILIFPANPNSAGLSMLHIYDLNQVNEEGLPRYTSGFYIDLGGDIITYGTTNYVYFFKTK